MRTSHEKTVPRRWVQNGSSRQRWPDPVEKGMSCIYVYIICTHIISWYSSLVWELSRILLFFHVHVGEFLLDLHPEAKVTSRKSWVEAPTETGRSEEGLYGSCGFWPRHLVWVSWMEKSSVYLLRQFFLAPAFLDSFLFFLKIVSHRFKKKRCSFPNRPPYWLLAG